MFIKHNIQKLGSPSPIPYGLIQQINRQYSNFKERLTHKNPPTDLLNHITRKTVRIKKWTILLLPRDSEQKREYGKKSVVGTVLLIAKLMA
ncbi:hypothetical protein KIN20_020417 [Parelaphostrongylus tenuis]|uniref:Uncharacterized protein n=1 Tax=Parelaphostrongylus tenuis TaxID=148309 RepID=A0AAD5MSU5_PARTN|nr:hypothetical protein KIN20_020417 [Parelaphostrongylus tenuis]